MFFENCWPSRVSSSSICLSRVAHLGRLVDAGAPVVAQRVLDEPLGVGIGADDVDGGERVVHLAIEREVRVEPRHLLLALARRVADRLVGMDLRHQARQRVASRSPRSAARCTGRACRRSCARVARDDLRAAAPARAAGRRDTLR